jgi:SAM-dependent methyltransferase
MKQSSSIRTFNDFREAAHAFRLPRILLTSIELDIFSVMGTQCWTTSKLAKKLSVSERGLEILCRNLASAGLVKNDRGRYSSGSFGQKFLSQKSPDYRGAYLKLIQQQWEDWGQLTQSVKSGKPLESSGPDDPEDRRSFTWAMHHRSIDAAKQVAEQLKIGKAKTFLDVGGGPGTYALAFVAKYPQLRATVWDREAAIDVAKEIAQSRKEKKRVDFQVGDFFKDAVQGTFDVMWLSNIIHIYSPKEIQSLFRKLLKSLNPGGKIFIQDTFLLDAKGLFPEETNLFAVTMLLFTETGNTYSAKEVKEWLSTAGFEKARAIQLKEGTGDWEGVILQASKKSPNKKGSRGRTNFRID